MSEELLQGDKYFCAVIVVGPAVTSEGLKSKVASLMGEIKPSF